MSSINSPRIAAFKADGVIAKGSAVKMGSDREHVAIGAAATDKLIGIAQSASTAAEDVIEVALLGGGAKALAQTTVTAGDILTSHTDGKLKPTTTAADRYIAVAMESAVANDVFAVEVVVGLI